MLGHFTIARILVCHVSVGNRGLSDVGKLLKLSQEICVRCWDMLEVGVSVGLNIAKTKTKEVFHNDIYVIIKEQVNYLV